MSLQKVREERRELGGAVKRGPRTLILIVLLVMVIIMISYLGGIS